MQPGNMDNAVLLTAEGTNGKIELLEHVIRIHELSKSGIDTVKEVTITEIKRFKLKQKGLTSGNIAFDFPGAPFLGGKQINFNDDHKQEFEQLAKELQKKLGIVDDEPIGNKSDAISKNIAKILQGRGISPADVLVAVEGANGQIILTDNGVIIAREGLGSKILSGYTKGEKFIPYRSITGVQFKEPGMSWGYIQLTLPGGIESRGGSWDASKDENTVTFQKDKLASFRKIRDIVEERQRRGTESMLQMPTPQASPRSSIAEELTKLATLKRDGAITEEEFVQLKKDLLSNH